MDVLPSGREHAGRWKRQPSWVAVHDLDLRRRWMRRSRTGMRTDGAEGCALIGGLAASVGPETMNQTLPNPSLQPTPDGHVSQVRTSLPGVAELGR